MTMTMTEAKAAAAAVEAMNKTRPCAEARLAEAKAVKCVGMTSTWAVVVVVNRRRITCTTMAEAMAA